MELLEPFGIGSSIARSRHACKMTSSTEAQKKEKVDASGNFRRSSRMRPYTSGSCETAWATRWAENTAINFELPDLAQDSLPACGR